ncbi:MAG TPA: peptidoglycan editing factor PgeF [Bdellovibrionota bacterium]|nr:peptidoglycan editing factor PgeF [Bdellovibrionota bacterium]
MAIELQRAPNFQAIGKLVHGYSTRQGGVSSGPYASLNLGWATGDDDDLVAKNYDLLAAALNTTPDRIFGVRQAHGANVVLIRKSDSREEILRREADALISNDPNCFLSVRVADCFPILLIDEERKALGVVHAGWRGTMARVLTATLIAMHQEFGSRPGDLQVAIGPGIGPCCFEVSLGVASLFLSNLAVAGKEIRQGEASSYLDLGAINLRLAMEAGVSKANTWRSPLCTWCEAETFYSYRREGKQSGRMVGIVGWVA